MKSLVSEEVGKVFFPSIHNDLLVIYFKIPKLMVVFSKFSLIADITEVNEFISIY